MRVFCPSGGTVHHNGTDTGATEWLVREGVETEYTCCIELNCSTALVTQHVPVPEPGIHHVAAVMILGAFVCRWWAYWRR